MNESLVELKIAIPASRLQALTEFAGELGMTPAQWLATQARAVTLPSSQNDQLVKLWARGMTDAEIARRLDWTNLAVATRRRAKKLPANRTSRKATR